MDNGVYELEENFKQKKRFTKEDFISILYFFLPLVCNIVIAIVFFIIIEIPFAYFGSDEVSLTALIIATILGFVIAIIRNFLNYFIPRKWRKFHLREIKILHWGVASILYFVVTAIGIFTIQAIFPFFKGVLLWPVASIIFVTSFDVFLFIYSGFLLSGELVGISGEGAFFFVIIFFPLLIFLFLPTVIFPNIFVYMGYNYGKKKMEQVEVSEKKIETEDEFEDKVKSELDVN